MGSVFALRVSHTRFLPLLDLDRPAPATRLFTTLADGQRKALFQFFYRRRIGGWRPVGRIEWDALPSGPAGEPTLELNLKPEGAGNLLLRLRERSSGASRSYRMSVPWRPRPETRPARKNAGSRRTALGLGLAALAAGLLAVAALAVFRFTPFWERLAGGLAAAGRRALVCAPGRSVRPLRPMPRKPLTFPDRRPPPSRRPGPRSRGGSRAVKPRGGAIPFLPGAVGRHPLADQRAVLRPRRPLRFISGRERHRRSGPARHGDRAPVAAQARGTGPGTMMAAERSV